MTTEQFAEQFGIMVSGILALFIIGLAIVKYKPAESVANDKSCKNCFWIQDEEHKRLICLEPGPPTRYVDKSIIKKFRCSRWSKRNGI